MLARIGDVQIWRVLESVTPFATVSWFFPTIDPDLLRQERPALEPHGLRHDPETGEDWILLPIQAFLVRTPASLILVDACVGNDKTLPSLDFWHQNRSGRFMAALAAAGATPADVTHVMCTHLHVDHVGWTTTLQDGQWVPTFPNAHVLATQADLDHARNAAESRPDGTAGLVWRESIAPLLQASRFDIVPPDHRLDAHVRLRSTPGHTPGHVSVEIIAPNAPAPPGVAAGGTITGDMIHSPIQVAAPLLSSRVDADPALAARTRQAFVQEAADTGRLILATHFPLPSAGHIRERSQGFTWEPALG